MFLSPQKIGFVMNRDFVLCSIDMDLSETHINWIYFFRNNTCDPILPKWEGESNSMEQNPSWEANSNSAIQEIPSLLWNPEVHYRVYKGPRLVPILSQMHPIHTFPPYSPKIQSNIIFLSKLRSSKWSLLFRFSNQNSAYIFLIPLIRATHSAPLILLDLFTLIVFGEAYKLWSFCSCSLLQPPTTSSLLGPNILLSTLFSKVLQSLYFP